WLAPRSDVGSYRQSSLSMRLHGGAKDFLFEARKRPAVHAELDQSRTNTRVLDPALPLADPATRELIDRLRLRVVRHEVPIRSEVAARDGEHVQPARRR